MIARLRRWLSEPLLHFIVAGGVIFAIYGIVARNETDDPQVVHVTAAELNWLKESWARQWNRTPSEAEFAGVVADYLKEVMLAREAQAVGIAENDVVVRRRLAQKMEFLLRDTVRIKEPGEEDLRAYYDRNAELFRLPARITFQQVPFSSEAAALQGLTELATRNADEVGSRSLLARDHRGIDRDIAAGLFGSDFANAIFALAPGTWQGPVPSVYGFHAVKVAEIQPATPRLFRDAREQVLDHYFRAKETEANDRLFTELSQKYKLVIDNEVVSFAHLRCGAAP